MRNLSTEQLQKIKPLLEEIIDDIEEKLDGMKYKLLLFGSWAKNDGLSLAEVDLAIDCEEEIEYDLLQEIKKILSEIPTVRPVEVVDYKYTTGERRELIDSTGKVIYSN